MGRNNGRPHGREGLPAEVFCPEDRPTERRVLAASLYHAVLSYRWIEPFVDRHYKAIRGWYYRLQHSFKPDCRNRQEAAVDLEFRLIHDTEHYIWTTVDCETLEMLLVEASLG